MNNLVVAAAQSSSSRGNLEENIAGHLRLIEVAAAEGVKLIVFPELSLTGYELDLAGSLQLEEDDPGLGPLRMAARELDMHVLVGAPIVSGLDRPFLGSFLFSRQRTVCYRKIHIHETEEGYFAPGQEACVLLIGGVPTALAICADTSHPEHAAQAAERDAKLYAASVMKTEDEYRAHAERLMRYALRHKMAVLSANYSGSTGGQVSAGGSAVWDERGDLVARAGPTGEALVVARRDNGEWCGDVITGL